MSRYTSPIPVEGFLDPDDPILFPRLTAAQIEQLAENAETLSLSPGEVEQGQRDTPLDVVLSGAIEIVDQQPEGDRDFTQCRPGTFAADISMFTPDGNGRLELVKFHSPSNQGDNRHAPANTPGIRHIAFAVEDIDAVVAGLRARGAELVGELERYEDSYRLCYVRGPQGVIIELAEQIG